METSDKEYQIQSILELTKLLREDELLGELRAALEERRVNFRTSLLVWFVESEDAKEYGVVVDSSRVVFEYSRDNDGGPASNFTKWRSLGPEEFHRFPEIAVALELLALGKTP